MDRNVQGYSQASQQLALVKSALKHEDALGQVKLRNQAGKLDKLQREIRKLERVPEDQRTAAQASRLSKLKQRFTAAIVALLTNFVNSGVGWLLGLPQQKPPTKTTQPLE